MARQLNDGDLVFRLGDGIWSENFRNSSPHLKRYSHVGVVQFFQGQCTVIHAEASDLTGIGHVKRDTLSQFMAATRDWGIYRYASDANRRALFAAACARRIGLRFDPFFDLATEDALYCTELPYVAAREVGLQPAIVASMSAGGKPEVFLDSCYEDEAVQKIVDSEVSALK